MKYVLVLLFSFHIIEISPALSEEKVSCEKLSDAFCDELWLKNKGNYTTAHSTFLFGHTKSGDSQMWMLSNQAFVDAVEKLTDYLKQKNTPKKLIRELKNEVKKFSRVLQQQNDSYEWDKKFSIQVKSIITLLDSIARELTYIRKPELRKKSKLDYTVWDKIEFSKDLQDLYNQNLRNKLEDHANWKRIQELFQEAQKDLVASITALHLSDAEKTWWIDRIQTIKLLLPYSDPRILADWGDCSQDANNAFYSPSFHAFTFCGGSILGDISDASHYRTLVHELSHSIDPSIRAIEAYYATPTYQRVKELYEGKVFACSAWEKIKTEEFAVLPEIQKRAWEVDPLKMCLLPEKQDLLPFETKTVKESVTNLVHYWTHYNATNNEFTRFVSPYTYVNHKRVKNPYYRSRRAMRFERTDNGTFETPITRRSYTPFFEIFDQELLCAKDEKGQPIDFYALKQSKQDTKRLQDIFQQAIASTRDITQNIFERLVEFTGDEDEYLIEYRLAKSSGENFADWLAFQTIEKKLQRIDGLQNKRDFIVESNAIYCTEPGPLLEEASMTQVEKKFSYQAHADDSARRMSIFTKGIRSLLKCEVSEEVAKKVSFGDCRL
ncbi:MAG: hypothetical protein R3A45_12425 [Bdellovibrionota bacterium]